MKRIGTIISPLLFISVLLSSCRGATTSNPDTVLATSVPEGTPSTILDGPPAPSAISNTPASGILKETVSLAWFYKPPENGPLSTLTEQFDFFILTHRDEEERDELRALGVDTDILQYLLFIQIMDPGSCDERPYGNQVAYQVGDFCQLTTEHPDWFLRDQQGNIIRKDLNVYMDPGNPGYQQFWLERAQQMQEEFGWQGIFIDNVEASLRKIKGLGITPANYQSDAEYQSAITAFLQYLHENYFEPQNIPVFANIIEMKDEAIWFSYLKYLDGAMIESFAVDYNNRHIPFAEWEKQLNLVLETLAAGKKLVLVAQGYENDVDREKFALASYLLVNDGNAYFRYSNSDSYNMIWLYDNYVLDLGSPLGPAYKTSGIWKRDFENGAVTVNPFFYTAEIRLDK